MKTRVILFLAVSAIATLSFTFVSINTDSTKKAKEVQSVKDLSSQPAGGFIAIDEI